MAATWTGDASESYFQHQQWDLAAAELNEILHSIARTVGDSNDRMKSINDAWRQAGHNGLARVHTRKLVPGAIGE